MDSYIDPILPWSGFQTFVLYASGVQKRKASMICRAYIEIVNNIICISPAQYIIIIKFVST
jgi:hypothetical protein